MPGSEQQVLRYLNTDSTLTDAERLALIESKPANAELEAADPLWIELRATLDADTARGNGVLFFSDDGKTATIQETAWQISQIDLGREIFVDGNSHYITSINVSNNSFAVDPAYTGEPGSPVRFLAGSVPYWRALEGTYTDKTGSARGTEGNLWDVL